MMYEDEAVFQQQGTVTKTWATRGLGTRVLNYPTRTSKKVIGAISAEFNPSYHFKFVDNFNTETFQAFLRQVMRHNQGRKVFMIVDNARYHHTKRLTEWLSTVKDQIELHYLPPYSPEFNGQERVWKMTRKMATHNRYFPTIESLHRTLFKRFNRFQGNPKSLRNIMAQFV